MEDSDLDLQAAQEHLRQLSCSNQEGEPWSLFETGPASLGVYGIGIELYFLFTRRFAVILGVVAALSAPMLLLNSIGDTLSVRSMAGSSTSIVAVLARTTVANLGTVDESGDLARDPDTGGRVVELFGSQSDIRDITLMFGTLDAAATLLVVLAALWFELVSIPVIIAKHRRMHVTPEAFTLSVHSLPRRLLEDNEEYAKRLRMHFEALLRASVTEDTVMPGMQVVRGSDTGGGTQTAWGWCCPCRARRGLDSKGRRLGCVTCVEGGVCEVEWQAVPGTVPKEVDTHCINGDSDDELLDAVLLARLEQDDCSPTRHEADEPLVHQVSLVRSYAGSCWSDAKRKPPRQVRSPPTARSSNDEVDAMATDESPEISGAFVVFNRTRHRDFLFVEYRLSRIFCGHRLQGRRHLFAGHSIVVDQAPSPSNVFWENLGLPPCRRCIWRLVATLACFLLLIGCVGLFSAAKQASLAAKEYSGSTACNGRNDNSTACACESAGYTNVLADEPMGIREKCLDWLNVKITAGAWGGAAAFSVIAINKLLEVIIVRLVDMQRPKTITSRSRKVMYMVFLVQLVNLGFITALVHFDLGTDILGDGLFGLIGNGTFRDFTSEWYVVVGGSVLLTMCLNTASPQLDVFSAHWTACRRQRNASRTQSQSELIDLYTPPHFEFAVRHAQQLSAIFVSMLFSAGMPLLTLMAFLGMCLFYWSDKYVLLRASRVPPRYTEYLMTNVVQLLPVASWLHSVVALWLYGNTDVVPSYCYDCVGGTTVQGLVYKMKAVGDELDLMSAITNRVFIASALPHIVVLSFTSLVLLLRLLHLLLGRRFQRSLASLQDFCLSHRRSVVEGRHSIFDDAFRDAPLREMKRLKVAHSYELADVPSELLGTTASTPDHQVPLLVASAPSSPTLLVSKAVSAFKGTGDASLLTPTSPTRACASWTASEASAYIASLRILTLPEDEAEQRFLEDVVMFAPLPESWSMARDRHGRLYFVSNSLRLSSWRHPLEHVFQELAQVCRNCIHCSELGRIAWIQEVRSEWTKEAQKELGKWRTVPQDNGRPYYYHLETRETTWRNPTEVMFPEFQARLMAIGWLANRAYFMHITRTGPASSSEPCLPAPVTPSAPPMSPSFLNPYCPSPYCN